MRKIINISAFILGIIIIIFMLIPTKVINRDAAVYVEHEWDTLSHVVIGSPKMLSVPQVHKSVVGYGYIVNHEKEMKTMVGKPIQQIDPYAYGRISNETDEISKTLKTAGVSNILRFNPEVLDLAELQYMKDVQQGNNFLLPKDSVVVIGNNIIECATRVPMRDKERFIVRRIVKPLIKEDASIRYIAVPIPSPAYPDNGLYLEGSDVLVDGNNVYVGFSGKTTSLSGIRWLQAALGANYKVYQIDFVNFRHLNDVLTLIRPGLAVRAMGAITSEMPKPLQNWEFIDVSPDDSKNFAASILVVGPNKVLVDERFENLVTELRNRNVDVTTVPFEEISTFGAGLASAYAPIKRDYDKAINTEEINKEYFIKKGNEILDTIKTFDYAKFFNEMQILITQKVNTLLKR